MTVLYTYTILKCLPNNSFRLLHISKEFTRTKDILKKIGTNSSVALYNCQD